MVDSNPLAIECLGKRGVLESLINCSNMMENIYSGINNYLEKKRLYFPR